MVLVDGGKFSERPLVLATLTRSSRGRVALKWKQAWYVQQTARQLTWLRHSDQRQRRPARRAQRQQVASAVSHPEWL